MGLELSNFHYQSFPVTSTRAANPLAMTPMEYKAKCDQLPCAAEVLHPTILDPSDKCAFLKTSDTQIS